MTQSSVRADEIKKFDELQLMDWLESKEIPREFCLEFESKYYPLNLTNFGSLSWCALRSIIGLYFCCVYKVACMLSSPLRSLYAFGVNGACLYLLLQKIVFDGVEFLLLKDEEKNGSSHRNGKEDHLVDSKTHGNAKLFTPT